jgi:hypothetical protein
MSSLGLQGCATHSTGAWSFFWSWSFIGDINRTTVGLGYGAGVSFIHFILLLCTIVIDIRAPVNAAPFRLPSNGTAGGLPVSVSWDSAHEGTIAFGRAEQKRSSSSLSSSTGISAAPFGASGLLMHGHRHCVLHWPTFSLASCQPKTTPIIDPQ